MFFGLVIKKIKVASTSHKKKDLTPTINTTKNKPLHVMKISIAVKTVET
jgi:hypothetical protein